ncbi:DUF397 domain-containing protein [Streptomyces sp. NPDC050617]|uniref:DUF397 domain-containing protein n=1 Tax=Streptomyces sp. NPDC050617 TaxID=3154628 RepID=UPI00342F5134
MHGLRWLKSSFSDEGGNNCIELAAYENDRIALRESGSPTAVLSPHRDALSALVRGVKSGAFIRTAPREL